MVFAANGRMGKRNKNLSVEVIGNKERLTPFLLRLALLDQQAESPTALLTAQRIRIYERLGNSLFSSPQTILDPFLGSDTTPKVSRALGRKSIGYQIDLELTDVVKQKLNNQQLTLSGDNIGTIIWQDDKNLKTDLEELVMKQRSVTKKSESSIIISLS